MTKKGSKNMPNEKDVGNNEAFQVINYGNVFFEHPRDDVHVARILIANASWIDTTEGTVVIDTLINRSNNCLRNFI